MPSDEEGKMTPPLPRTALLYVNAGIWHGTIRMHLHGFEEEGTLAL